VLYFRPVTFSVFESQLLKTRKNGKDFYSCFYIFFFYFFDGFLNKILHKTNVIHMSKSEKKIFPCCFFSLCCFNVIVWMYCDTCFLEVSQHIHQHQPTFLGCFFIIPNDGRLLRCRLFTSSIYVYVDQC
jgi:hypothetical protein